MTLKLFELVGSDPTRSSGKAPLLLDGDAPVRANRRDIAALQLPQLAQAFPVMRSSLTTVATILAAGPSKSVGFK